MLQSTAIGRKAGFPFALALGPSTTGYDRRSQRAMIKNLIIVAAIAVTVMIAYSMGTKENNAKVNDMKSQIDSLKAQLGSQGKNIQESYNRLHRSLNLHMAETSIETAIHDTLDQNFGEARVAIESAKKYLQHAEGKRVSSEDLSTIVGNLDSASQDLKALDKKALKTLSDAEKQVRDLIAKNAS
jgi:gas vesicle protein